MLSNFVLYPGNLFFIMLCDSGYCVNPMVNVDVFVLAGIDVVRFRSNKVLTSLLFLWVVVSTCFVFKMVVVLIVYTVSCVCATYWLVWDPGSSASPVVGCQGLCSAV